MKIKLYSDFIDYYDHHFDIIGKRFNRFSYNGLNRIKMFKYLENHGYKVIEYGLVRDFANKILRFREYMNKDIERSDMWKTVELVVYTDLNAHTGNGKLRINLCDAMLSYPDNMASLFIYNYSTSYRYLQIGDTSFELKYIGKTDWRSNYGDVNILIKNRNNGYHKNIKYPLFAIDFIEILYPYKHLVAIDFNISPCIKGTGIENILKPKDVVNLIKTFYEDNYELNSFFRSFNIRE